MFNEIVFPIYNVIISRNMSLVFLFTMIENSAKNDEIDNLAERLGNKYVCFKLNIILQAKMSNSIVDFL